jgi:hypothetical protein
MQEQMPEPEPEQQPEQQQRQRPMRGSFAALRMTTENGRRKRVVANGWWERDSG